MERPTRRVALLMAEIERTEHGDEGRARQWMARALNAPRDPAWIADGIVSERWLPMSPVSGRLDAFAWTTPLADAGRSARAGYPRAVVRGRSSRRCRCASRRPPLLDAGRAGSR